MSLLPIFLHLDRRRCLLVGAGRVALGKVESLLNAGAQLTLVAPEAIAELRQLAGQGQLNWLQRCFQPEDLDGKFLVIAATDSAKVNASVYQAAVERRILCNSVDDIPNCDFFFGSVVSRGSLQVAISTAGQSPAFAQRLRHEIDEQLPADLGPWLAELGDLRRQILLEQPPGEARRLLLHQLAQRELCSSENCPSRLAAFPAEEPQPDEEPENQIYSDPDDLAQPFDPNLPDPQPAQVYLVGAGPGDPDLLTVKAVRLIQTADVILHDDLVSTQILDLASPSALVENVGKRYGAKSITQEQINRLIIDHARQGRSVLRLKGGDPLLFGRAAEEIAALSAAAISFEIVPGITAAFAAAAAAGFSLTDRARASSVLFTTGHRAHPQDEQLPSPDPLTRVVYMPGRQLQQLQKQWIAQGLAPDLPCLVVSRASQPDQLLFRTTLAALDQTPACPAPSLVLAGWALR